MSFFVSQINSGGIVYPHQSGWLFNPLAKLAGLTIEISPCFCLCGVYDYDDSTAFAIGSINVIEIKSTGVISSLPTMLRIL